MLAPPYSGFSNAAEFYPAGLPWVTSSITSGSAVKEYDFQRISKVIQVTNLDSTYANAIRVGFTLNGINGGNYFVIPGGTTQEFDVRCKSLFVRADVTGSTKFSVFAGLTMIPSGQMPELTASLSSSTDGVYPGWSGVG